MTPAARAEWMRNWRRNNPEKVAAYAKRHSAIRKGPRNRKYNLKSGFGVETPQVIEDMLSAQGGRCAICGKKLVLPHKHTHIDHDHTTKHRLRGILCHHCNVGLGHFKDRAALLRKAAEYLDFYTPKSRRAQ